MGGGKKFDYPKYVWSPSGGWWCNPRNWKRNTFFIGMGTIAFLIPLGMYLESITVTHIPPHRAVYSERLCKLAKEQRESHHH